MDEGGTLSCRNLVWLYKMYNKYYIYYVTEYSVLRSTVLRKIVLQNPVNIINRIFYTKKNKVVVVF